MRCELLQDLLLCRYYAGKTAFSAAAAMGVTGAESRCVGHSLRETGERTAYSCRALPLNIYARALLSMKRSVFLDCFYGSGFPTSL